MGGEAGFRRLVEAGHEMGFAMSVHDNFMMNVPHAPDYDPECLIHDVYGEPLVSGWWAGGLERESWPLAFPRERLEGHLERMRGLGLRSQYYCDYMMRPLEVNYHPRHGGPRADHAAGQRRILAACREAFGSAATEVGTLPALLECDAISSVPGNRPRNPRWPVTQLLDREVKLWHLAVHGLVTLEQKQPSWRSLLQCVSLGLHPRDEWSADRPKSPMPALDDARIARQKAVYDIALERFGRLQYEPLTDYRQPEAGVVETRFGDGTAVVADFTNETLEVDGARVERPSALAPSEPG